MPTPKKHVAIVGATGIVGQELCRILRARSFPVASLRLLASERSAGREIEALTGPQRVEQLTPDSFADIDIAFFSAGATVSREFAPLATQAGALVIDNSSAFRMNPEVPLVVPEINADAAQTHQGIIANPNCSATILVMALWPLHRLGYLRRVIVSTYQAASGAGARALAELESQTRQVLAGEPPQPAAFSVPCAFNVFSHNSPIGPDGQNVEERKIAEESRKIMNLKDLRVSATCLRVPVRRAHTESILIELAESVTPFQAREALAAMPGIRVIDDRDTGNFPTPLAASDQDDILVGRIRPDPSLSDATGLALICAGDQLRKGAALNAIQIAETVAGD